MRQKTPEAELSDPHFKSRFYEHVSHDLEEVISTYASEQAHVNESATSTLRGHPGYSSTLLSLPHSSLFYH
jgi:hypothetical protein